MVCCCIRRCGKNSKKSNYKTDGITFHRFPANPDLKEKWVELTRRENWFPTKKSTVCSRHFTEDCFHIMESGRRRLFHNAMPTKYLPLLTNATATKIVQSPNPRASTSKKRTPSRKSISPTKFNFTTKKLETQSKQQKCSQQISPEALRSETTSSTPETMQHNSTVFVHLSLKQETRDKENCSQASTSSPEIKGQNSTDTSHITINQETRVKEENSSQPQALSSENQGISLTTEFKKENCDTIHISIKQETDVIEENCSAALEHQTTLLTPKIEQQNSIDTTNSNVTHERRIKENSYSPRPTSSENLTTLSILRRRLCNEAPKLPILIPKPVQGNHTILALLPNSYFGVKPVLSFHPENHPISKITTKKLKTSDPAPSSQLDSVTQNRLYRRNLYLTGKLNQKSKQLKVVRDQLRYYKKKVLSQNAIIDELLCKSNTNEKISDMENKIGDLDTD